MEKPAPWPIRTLGAEGTGIAGSLAPRSLKRPRRERDACPFFVRSFDHEHSASKEGCRHSPTLSSLDLTNQNSKLTLEIFLKTRESGSSEDHALADECLRKALRDEQGAPQRTRAYLLALQGDLLLNSGNWNFAIAKLEEANRRLPRDPHIQSLLLRSYEAASLKLQDTSRPWSAEVQEQIRLFSKKAEELRQELRHNSARCTDCHSTSAGRGAGTLAEIGTEKLRLSIGINTIGSHTSVSWPSRSVESYKEFLAMLFNEGNSEVGQVSWRSGRARLLSFPISNEMDSANRFAQDAFTYDTDTGSEKIPNAMGNAAVSDDL
ncbi:MAG: hypothetical protein JF614_20610 [Acidobacteria bacterium]|nr:hypothetical protein [Acidobacteriota bacterium]